MKYLFLIGIILTVSGCQVTRPPAPSYKEKEQAGVQRKPEPREILAGSLSFDVTTGRIKYTLPEDALVRIRVGLKDGGPLLRHVVDWELRKAGEHTESWDKKDASGQITFGSGNNFMIIIACRPLNAREHWNNSLGIKGLRKSPEFQMTLPSARTYTKDGLPVVSGIAPLRIFLEKEDQQWLAETRYELGLYVDYVFLMEEEEGVNPFTYDLDTRKLNDGPHTLTANIVGYDGEVGTRSILISVKNQ